MKLWDKLAEWIEAVWAESKLKGIAVLVGLALATIVVLAFVAWLLGIDVAGMVQDGISTLRAGAPKGYGG